MSTKHKIVNYKIAFFTATVTQIRKPETKVSQCIPAMKCKKNFDEKQNAMS